MNDQWEVERTAAGLLTSREHTRQELFRKLINRGYTPELVIPVLDRMESAGQLSDERFTEQYVQLRLRKGYGPLRIRHELQDRGVAESLIDGWLDEPGMDWAEQLRSVAEQKFGDSPMVNDKERGRRARFLEYRGYPSSLISDYLFDA